MSVGNKHKIQLNLNTLSHAFSSQLINDHHYTDINLFGLRMILFECCWYGLSVFHFVSLK